MLKIVLTGSESTGKTTLSKDLSTHFDCPWIGEYAREYLDQIKRPYQEDDLLQVAKGQLANEKGREDSKSNIFICDTDLLTIKIWSNYKYGKCAPWILEQMQKHKADFYLLCGIDIPWVPDPQREHPENRAELFDIYKKELEKMGVPFLILKGGEKKRLKNAISSIEQLI